MDYQFSLYPPELQKCYFLFNHKQIRSKVPILLYFVRPKRPSGNCYISCFLTEKTPLLHSLSHFIRGRSFSKPSLKIRTASAIFWIYLGIVRDYDLKNIFYRNETFFVFQDRKLKLSASALNKIS